MRSTMLPHRRLPSSTFSPICLLSSRKLWASFKMALIGVYPHDLFTGRRVCYKAMSWCIGTPWPVPQAVLWTQENEAIAEWLSELLRQTAGGICEAQYRQPFGSGLDTRTLGL